MIVCLAQQFLKRSAPAGWCAVLESYDLAQRVCETPVGSTADIDNFFHELFQASGRSSITLLELSKRVKARNDLGKTLQFHRGCTLR